MKDIMSFSGFIFDMDGTLIDLERLNYIGYRDTIRKHYDITVKPEDYQKYFSGVKTADGFGGFLKAQSLSTNSELIIGLVNDFRSSKRDNLANRPGEVSKLIPGAKEFLTKIKNTPNNKIALATSTIREFTEILLRYYGIETFFDVIISAEDVKNGKPDPEIYLSAIEKLGLPKESCIAFEDSGNGIGSAKSAGLYCVGIHTPGLNDTEVKSADMVVEDYFDMI